MSLQNCRKVIVATTSFHFILFISHPLWLFCSKNKNHHYRKLYSFLKNIGWCIIRYNYVQLQYVQYVHFF